MGSLASIRVEERPLARDVLSLANNFMRLQISEDGSVLAYVEAQSLLMEQIKESQFEDAKLCIIRDNVLRCEANEEILYQEGVLYIRGKICVPKMGDLIRLILEKAHSLRYSIHPGVAKMYHDLSQHYWWYGMKRDIMDFVGKCLNC